MKNWQKKKFNMFQLQESAKMLNTILPIHYFAMVVA